MKQLNDLSAKAKILTRIDRMKGGNFGNAEPVGDGIFELKIDFGPGYRVYYVRNGKVLYLLLNSGDKSTQQDDIKQAKAMWADIGKGRKR